MGAGGQSTRVRIVHRLPHTTRNLPMSSSTELIIDFGKCKQKAKYNLTLYYGSRGLVIHPRVSVFRIFGTYKSYRASIEHDIG